jgi:tetratricopeptide (TPR) repeat protein
MERFSEADEQMRAAITLQPSAAAPYNALANRYIKARRYADALPPLETSRKIAPSTVGALVMQGMAYSGLGNYPEALSRFQDAARLQRTN